MSTINMAKTECVVTFQGFEFNVTSYSCDIVQKIAWYNTLGQNFLTETQGVAPFELILKGYFNTHTSLNLPELYTVVKNFPINQIYIKDIRFSNSRLMGVKVLENMNKQTVECELKFLVLGSVLVYAG